MIEAAFRRKLPMIKIFLPYVYSLAEALEPITAISTGSKYSDVVVSLYAARATIDTFLNHSVFAHNIRSCRNHGQVLISTLDAIINTTDDRELTPYETFSISHQAMQFKTAMLAEVGVFPSYFVIQKGSYDTLTLLDNGQRLFPTDLHEKVPEATFYTSEAAKALAYELPTATGFHAFRATESVLRRYYSHVTGGDPPPKVRNIGVYIRKMRIRKCVTR
jgi:hypothetical protein